MSKNEKRADTGSTSDGLMKTGALNLNRKYVAEIINELIISKVTEMEKRHKAWILFASYLTRKR